MAKRSYRKMTDQEKAEWKELCAYVHSDVMQYDENQGLNTPMCLRLKGLTQNKFMANNNIENAANYSFKVILNTFIYCMPKIKSAVSSCAFQDEMHKFNYILKIVEKDINTVYIRMKAAEKAEKEVAECDFTESFEYVNNFKASEKKPISNKLDDLW